MSAKRDTAPYCGQVSEIFYKTMPCVGGFTDGAVSKFGKGALDIVTGKDRNYGFKSIGLFQTSDNRKRDHSDLGKHTTWVKWSEPTAEALRQACLAKESRLSQGEPNLPEIRRSGAMALLSCCVARRCEVFCKNTGTGFWR